jgi:glycosyltransferase involved in cell wall biosynthesis
MSVAGLARRGWQCHVIAPKYPPPTSAAFPDVETPNGASATALPSARLPGYPDIRLAAPLLGQVARAIDRFRPDIIHSATEFVIGWMGQRMALTRHVPAVSSYHTDFARYARAYRVPWMAAPVARFIARFHARSRRTYTPSVSARDDLLALGLHDVEVWGRGVDASAFHPSKRSEPLRDTYGGRDGVILLHVGRLAPEKGVEHILQAFAVAQQQLPVGAVQLVVAGTGPSEPALRQMASPNVTFLGNLDRRSVLPRLYASADAFLFASVTETLGLVVLEAMASGLPVIAAPAGGVADHLRHDVNGLAYRPNDVSALAHAIIAIVLERDKRKRLGQQARATAEALSWESELDRLDVSYREVLAQSQQPHGLIAASAA